MLNTQRDEFTPITPETKERLLSVQRIKEENHRDVCLGLPQGNPAVIFAVCVSVPLVMYGQIEKRSVTQRAEE